MFPVIIFGGLAAALSILIVLWEGLAVYRINKQARFGRLCYWAIHNRFHVGTFIFLISLPMIPTAGVTLFSIINVMNMFVSLFLYLSYRIWQQIEDKDLNRGFLRFSFKIIKLIIRDKYEANFKY